MRLKDLGPLTFLTGSLTLALVMAVALPVRAAIISPIAPITADQARSREGENVTIAGTAHIHKAQRRQGTYIDLDGQGPTSPFAGYISDNDVWVFPNLKKLNGKPVEINGTVQFRNGTPIIIMTEASQLRAAR